jgi:putative peptidoglycan lipid II flippase
MQAPLGILGQSLAIAVFPVLTQFFTQNRMDLFRNQLDRTMRTVIYLTVPISVLLAVLAPQISSGLYLGPRVTHEQTLEIATCLRLFCVGIWAWCLHPVLMRAFYSLHDTKTPVIIGTATTGFFFVLALIGIRTPMGYFALPLAGSIAPIVMVFALCFVGAKKVGGMDFSGLVTTFGKSALGSIGVGIVCAIVSMTPLAAMMLGHKIATLLITAFVFCVAMWVYYFITKAMKMPECEYLDRIANKLPGQRKGK